MTDLSRYRRIVRPGLRHGQTVTYDGREWLVWCQAPGRHHWWLIRWEDDGGRSVCVSADAVRYRIREVRPSA